jgi:hypothetical protein
MRFYKQPKQNTYVFACDDNYFLKYGVSCLNSAKETGNNIHCHILNPQQNTVKNIQRISNESDFVSFSTSQETNKNKLNPGYYTNMRFDLIDDLFKYSNKIAIIDTDSIFLQNSMNIFEHDIGIHERNLSSPAEKERVLTGFVLISKCCVKFIEILQKKRKSIGNYWFSDQIAMARTIIEYKKCQEFLNIKYRKVPLSYIDYTFQDDSYIWSGKGERKNDNKIYLTKFKQYNKK